MRGALNVTSLTPPFFTYQKWCVFYFSFVYGKKYVLFCLRRIHYRLSLTPLLAFTPLTPWPLTEYTDCLSCLQKNTLHYVPSVVLRTAYKHCVSKILSHPLTFLTFWANLVQLMCVTWITRRSKKGYVVAGDNVFIYVLCVLCVSSGGREMSCVRKLIEH